MFLCLHLWSQSKVVLTWHYYRISTTIWNWSFPPVFWWPDILIMISWWGVRGQKSSSCPQHVPFLLGCVGRQKHWGVLSSCLHLWWCSSTSSCGWELKSLVWAREKALLWWGSIPGTPSFAKLLVVCTDPGAGAIRQVYWGIIFQSCFRTQLTETCLSAHMK